MSGAAAAAAKRASRRAKGHCTECDTPALPGRPVCARHDEIQKKGMARFLGRLQRHNLCGCGAKRAPRRSKCSTCLEIAATKELARREERLQQGLCTNCGKHRARGGDWCGYCKRSAREQYHDQRVGELRQRLRELIDRDKLPLPPTIRAHPRFYLARMVELEVDPNSTHWRPAEGACRQYAKAHPRWEGFVLLTSRTALQMQQRAYLVTRHPSTNRRERIDVMFIPTTTDVPWRQYN